VFDSWALTLCVDRVNAANALRRTTAIAKTMPIRHALTACRYTRAPRRELLTTQQPAPELLIPQQPMRP
jgi:hypothetical protein